MATPVVGWAAGRVGGGLGGGEGGGGDGGGAGRGGDGGCEGGGGDGGGEDEGDIKYIVKKTQPPEKNLKKKSQKKY